MVAKGMTKHHLYWPRRDYQVGLEKKFRNLPCNVVLMDELKHRQLHATTRPPKKPTRTKMALATAAHDEGRCSCGQDRVSKVPEES